MNEGLVLVHSIHHQRSAPANVVDSFVCEFLDTSGFDNDVEPIRVFLDCSWLRHY
jgi:hypothetical protein